MPTIRELVSAIAQREGVEAAIVLGSDGMVIDGRSANGLDAEHLAAHVPALLAAAQELARVGHRGSLTTAVLEFQDGMAVVSALTPEAILFVLVHASANLGALLHELRRHHGNIASLV